MAIAETPLIQTVRGDLLARREKLENVIERNRSEQLAELLTQVDQALERIDNGTIGICEVCHDTIEEDRVLRDPLISVCLGCLTPRQQRALEYDLELAARIQNGSLPGTDVSIPGWEIAYLYRPAGVVGGDYCDVILDNKGGVYFVIADVAGKGRGRGDAHGPSAGSNSGVSSTAPAAGEDAASGKPALLREQAAHAICNAGGGAQFGCRQSGVSQCWTLAGNGSARIADRVI